MSDSLTQRWPSKPIPSADVVELLEQDWQLMPWFSVPYEWEFLHGNFDGDEVSVSSSKRNNVKAPTTQSVYRCLVLARPPGDTIRKEGKS